MTSEQNIEVETAIAATEEEELSIEETDSAEEESQDNLTFEISYYPADLTVQGYIDKDTAGQLVIPDFQRKYVWTQIQASKLIESLLLGLPVPNVFLYKEKKTNKLFIIDGQQRIRSAINFVKGIFGERSFRLKGVNARWEGKKFDELSDAEKLQIKDSVFRATIVQQLDPDDDSSVYHIFERLNSGGTKLNSMEVRRSVYFGEAIRVLEKLNEIPEWREIIGKPTPDIGYKDVELVLRVVALSKLWRTYEKPMKEFLNKFLTSNKLSPRPVFEDWVTTFTEASQIILSSLGGKPFHLRGRLNYALMDSIFVAVIENKINTNFKSKFDTLLRNADFIASCSVSTSDEKVVSHRLNLAISALK